MNKVVLSCPSVLSIAETAEFRTRLLALPADAPVVIDASEVSRIDGAGVQLLLAFVRKLDADGRSWSWSGRAQCIDRAARTLAVADSLGIAGAKE